MKLVKCIRNDSKTLPFRVNQIYSVGYDFGGGLFEIYDGPRFSNPGSSER